MKVVGEMGWPIYSILSYPYYRIKSTQINIHVPFILDFITLIHKPHSFVRTRDSRASGDLPPQFSTQQRLGWHGDTPEKFARAEISIQRKHKVCSQRRSLKNGVSSLVVWQAMVRLPELLDVKCRVTKFCKIKFQADVTTA